VRRRSESTCRAIRFRSLVEGSTENATLVTELLVGLRERGLGVTRPILACLAGVKAPHRAVLDVLDAPVIHRCQLHKIRNVRDKLAQRLRPGVERRMRAAYHASPRRHGQSWRCTAAQTRRSQTATKSTSTPPVSGCCSAINASAINAASHAARRAGSLENNTGSCLTKLSSWAVSRGCASR
jgi:hypothetical protein